jgi:hypothetical protein
MKRTAAILFLSGMFAIGAAAQSAGAQDPQPTRTAPSVTALNAPIDQRAAADPAQLTLKDLQDTIRDLSAQVGDAQVALRATQRQLQEWKTRALAAEAKLATVTSLVPTAAPPVAKKP